MPTKIPCSLLFCPESNWVLTKQCLPSSSEQFPCSPLNILYCLPFIISHILFCCVFTSTHFGSPAPLETGIEPVTPRLTVGCSNQLSYSSKYRAPLPCSLTALPYRAPLIPPVGFEPTKHLQCILSAPPLTGLGYSGIFGQITPYRGMVWLRPFSLTTI